MTIARCSKPPLRGRKVMILVFSASNSGTRASDTRSKASAEAIR
jgi:hypothetical protein